MESNDAKKSLDEEPPTTSTAKKSNPTNATPIGNFSSIEEFTKNGFAEVMAAAKAVNAFPQAAARDLYCAYPTFGKIVDEQSDRILGLMSKVIKKQKVKGNIQRRLPDEQFEMLLECNDSILERLNSNLDIMSGLKKNPETIVVESLLAANSPTTQISGKVAGSWNLKKNNTSPTAARLITAKNIARPQLKFSVPVDNSAATPFVPRIKDKPNSLKPLAVLPEYDDVGNVVSYLHPYEFELMKFEVSEDQLKRKHPQMPPAITSTDFTYVDTLPKLKIALEELRQQKEIAVDVEHHSYRTFLGFTCLVQISTRSKDYIFDALELREEMHILNEVFTDPRILKIFHGADLDIEWLQRDLSLYVVNLFDTHQAAKVMNFARLSLSYLLKHYCDIDADKTFQLADWRIRPLPAELITYARQDTHFLIYVYECLTNDLLDAANQKANLLRTTYERSTELCKKRFVKPFVGADSHIDVLRKSHRIFDNRQLFALREIFQWRNTVSRLEDESFGYVLPNHMMLHIAETLPREMQGILACCNPIPPLVRQHLHALHEIILRAREQPLVKPILETSVVSRVNTTNLMDYNNKLYCPHDLSNCDEIIENLPTLINMDSSLKPVAPTESEQRTDHICQPKLSIFEATETLAENDNIKNKKEIVSKMRFISPYQRYLAILPQIAKEKIEEAKRIEAENKKRKLCPEAPMLPVKKEVVVNPGPEDDDGFRASIKDMLKRKYEESVANKAATRKDEPKVKCIKIVTPTDDKLKFIDLPSSQKKQKQVPIAASDKRTAKTTNDLVHSISDNSNEPPDEMPSTSQPQQSHTQSQQKFKNKNQNKKNKLKARKTHQDSNQAVPENFDYQNVDFKKFQGGAKRAKGAELKPQFHGKGNSNKANNKKFNKLFTFSNVKSNKK